MINFSARCFQLEQDNYVLKAEIQKLTTERDSFRLETEKLHQHIALKRGESEAPTCPTCGRTQSKLTADWGHGNIHEGRLCLHCRQDARKRKPCKLCDGRKYVRFSLIRVPCPVCTSEPTVAEYHASISRSLLQRIEKMTARRKKLYSVLDNMKQQLAAVVKQRDMALIKVKQLQGINQALQAPRPEDIEAEISRRDIAMYKEGWCCCAVWADRDDLITDCDSDAFRKTMNVEIAKVNARFRPAPPVVMPVAPVTSVCDLCDGKKVILAGGPSVHHYTACPKCATPQTKYSIEDAADAGIRPPLCPSCVPAFDAGHSRCPQCRNALP